MSMLEVETEDKGTKGTIKKLMADLGILCKGDLPAFTSKTRNCASHSGANQAGPSVHGGGGSGTTEQLKSYGYEVIPDIIETDSSTWESINKLPPHICTVY
ncbi:hypothetical protein EDB83DRAFT_2320542 [Lactarius deliciosus]|nr:hypothetical protein EDB83DRAFT_2320542 [Lactarius deliciosus]